MSIDQIRAQLVGNIWQAMAQAAWTSRCSRTAGKLVRTIADRLMVAMNDIRRSHQ
jgi:hypothetical protein